MSSSAISSSQGSKKIHSASINQENVALWFEIIDSELPPQQELRELYTNARQAIEARCQREGRALAGEIQLRMYPKSLERYGAPKLAVIDNGEGMSPRDLVVYINKILSSGRDFGLGKNHGSGGTLTALASEAGVVYESWQNGQGHRVIFSRHPDGTFGLEEFNSSRAVEVDGLKLVEKIPSSEMPKIIRDSGGYGTMVILLGQDAAKSNTLEEPSNFAFADDMHKKENWLAIAINKKFYDIPEGIVVNTSTAANPSESLRFRRAFGTGHFLDKHLRQRGTLHLPGCDFHWGILNPNQTYKNDKQVFGSGARIGYLHDGEIYYYTSGSKARGKLSGSFGIYFGLSDIVLFIEPHNASPTFSRADLKIDGKPLPMEEWAELFKRNLPEPIKKHMDKKKKVNVNPQEQIDKIVENINNYSSAPRKITADATGKKIGGNVIKGDSAISSTLSKNAAPPTTTLATPSLSVSATSSPAKQQGNSLTPGIKKAARRKKVILDSKRDAPKCTWASDENAGLGNNFGRYDLDNNTIVLNKDFPLYCDVVKRWTDVKSDRETVISKIQFLFSTRAIEAVLAIKSLEGRSGGWEKDRVEKHLRQENFNSVATQRLSMEEKITQMMQNVK